MKPDLVDIAFQLFPHSGVVLATSPIPAPEAGSARGEFYWTGTVFNERRLRSGMMVCILLLITGSISQGQPADRVYESRFYTIYHNLSDEQVRRHADHMDLIYGEYSRRFHGLRDWRKGRMNLYLLNSREGYQRQLASFGVDGSASGGMFFYGPHGSGLATWIQGRSEADIHGILQHEGLHQFAHNYLGSHVPLWLNEGLAEYFEQAQIIQGKVKQGIAEPGRIERLKAAIEAEEIFQFDELLNISGDEWRANMVSGSPRGSLQYIQSWSIVYFLIHADKGKYRRAFQKYLNQLSNGRTHKSAFQTAFGATDTRRFHARWQHFAREQLKPDNYSIAIHRMHFLGQGLLFLSHSGESMPADIDSLRHTLQEKGFSVTRFGHAGQTKIAASDESLYRYQDSKNQKREFEIVLPDTEGKIPKIQALGLRPVPILDWEVAHEGGWRAVVKYK